MSKPTFHVYSAKCLGISASGDHCGWHHFVLRERANLQSSDPDKSGLRCLKCGGELVGVRFVTTVEAADEAGAFHALRLYCGDIEARGLVITAVRRLRAIADMLESFYHTHGAFAVDSDEEADWSGDDPFLGPFDGDES